MRDVPSYWYPIDALAQAGRVSISTRTNSNSPDAMSRGEQRHNNYSNNNVGIVSEEEMLYTIRYAGPDDARRRPFSLPMRSQRVLSGDAFHEAFECPRVLSTCRVQLPPPAPSTRGCSFRCLIRGTAAPAHTLALR